MAPYCKDVKQTAYDPEAAKATLAAKGVTSLQCITYTSSRPYNQKGGSGSPASSRATWPRSAWT